MKLTDESVRNLLRRGISLWGEEAQWGMVIEELSEMIVMINRYRRKRVEQEDLAAEVADALIVIEQAAIMETFSVFRDEPVHDDWDQITVDCSMYVTVICLHRSTTVFSQADRSMRFHMALYAVQKARSLIGENLVDSYIEKKLKRLEECVKQGEQARG